MSEDTQLLKTLIEQQQTATVILRRIHYTSLVIAGLIAVPILWAILSKLLVAIVALPVTTVG